MSEPKREPKAGDLWDVEETVLLLYSTGAGGIELGNVIVSKGYCSLGGMQGEDLIKWLKRDGRFLCSLSDLSDRINKL